MKVVQQLTCLTLDRPNGPAYSTGELFNTPSNQHSYRRQLAHVSLNRCRPTDVLLNTLQTTT